MPSSRPLARMPHRRATAMAAMGLVTLALIGPIAGARAADPPVPAPGDPAAPAHPAAPTATGPVAPTSPAAPGGVPTPPIIQTPWASVTPEPRSSMATVTAVPEPTEPTPMVTHLPPTPRAVPAGKHNGPTTPMLEDAQFVRSPDWRLAPHPDWLLAPVDKTRGNQYVRTADQCQFTLFRSVLDGGGSGSDWDATTGELLSAIDSLKARDDAASAGARLRHWFARGDGRSAIEFSTISVRYTRKDLEQQWQSVFAMRSMPTSASLMRVTVSCPQAVFDRGADPTAQIFGLLSVVEG